MSGNKGINEEELRILNTWWDKMKAWHLPEDLFTGAAPVAMRPFRFMLSDEDTDGDDALEMIELIRTDHKKIWLFFDSEKWDLYFDRDEEKMMVGFHDIYYIDDKCSSVEETFAKLIPCFQEVLIPKSYWSEDGPNMYLLCPGLLKLDRASFRYYLKEESLPSLTEDPFLTDLLGEILTAWEEGAAEEIVEEECYAKYWKPQMMKLLKVYREGLKEKTTMADWFRVGGAAIAGLFGKENMMKTNVKVKQKNYECPPLSLLNIGVSEADLSGFKMIAEPVMLRELLDTESFKDFKDDLAFAVGKDLTGAPVVADLAAMPHLLIAGGIGPVISVCINNIIMSILYKAAPSDVRMIMIDSVGLSVYSGIPHLIGQVIEDPRQAVDVLDRTVAEMDRRYKVFRDTGVRDLNSYNEHIGRMSEEERAAAGIVKMPRILVIVKELADLMMVCGDGVESSIVRLTQAGRAVGIHLVIATLQPSGDVITGFIKANIPSRIAFDASDAEESLTILDMPGAERLTGWGSMLFFPRGYSRPKRVQEAFVSDEEIDRVVNFIKEQKYNVEDSVFSEKDIRK